MDMEEPNRQRTNDKVYADFQLCGGSAPLAPSWFKGQLYYSLFYICPKVIRNKEMTPIQICEKKFKVSFQKYLHIKFKNFSLMKVSFSTMLPNSVFVKKLEKIIIFFCVANRIKISVSSKIDIALIFYSFIYFTKFL